MVELAAIAGVAKNGVIGDGEDIPWHYKEDHNQYKRRVRDHPVIVGRKTYDQMGKIPTTIPIVVTRSPQSRSETGAIYVSSVGEAVMEAEQHSDRVYIIGGQSIYSLFLPYTNRVLISEIPEYDHGSRVFPYLGTDWKIQTVHEYTEFQLVEYVQPNPRSIDG